MNLSSLYLPTLCSAKSWISWTTVHSFLEFLQVYRATLHQLCGCTSNDEMHHGVQSSGKSWITSNAFLALLGQRWLAKLTSDEESHTSCRDDGISSPLISYCKLFRDRLWITSKRPGLAERIILSPSGDIFMRIKYGNFRRIWPRAVPSFEYLFMSHARTVSSKAEVTRSPDGLWYSILFTQSVCPSMLITLLLRFLQSQRATVVSSEQVTKLLLSKNRIQLTQSQWASRTAATCFWQRGSNTSRLCLSHAATRKSPSDENSRLKIAPWPALFGLSSGSHIFLNDKYL